jgi:predicted dehydrogenase
MNFLIIGLGSMGKRRIRCLKKLGYTNILGYDVMEKRRQEAEEKYGVRTVDGLAPSVLQASEVIFISTPPDRHNEYIKLAIENNKPAFVEAGVILEGLRELNRLAKNRNVLIAPSCTMRFHPAIKEIKNIVISGKYGKVTNFTYHSGQYLPDWHPWESPRDFYVSRKETGGCREIVPFELTWITDIMGFPERVSGFHGKTMDVRADIDDTYVISMVFKDKYGNMTVDVVSRYATRSLILNMERGQILWRWDENVVKLFDAANRRWVHYYLPEGQAEEGYSKHIVEDMYVEETESFIAAVKGDREYPNSLDDDIRVLELLHSIEASQ